MATDPLARFTHLTAPPVDGSTAEATQVQVVYSDRGRPSFWTDGALATVDWSEEPEEDSSTDTTEDSSTLLSS